MIWASPAVRGFACACVLVAVFFGWLWMHDAKIESRSAVRVVEKINEVNTNAANLGNGAAAGALDKRVRGLRDPTTRDD